MKLSLKTMLLPLALGCCATTALAAPASVMVSDCWVRALPGNLPAGGYFNLMNMSAKPVGLTDVSTPAFDMAMLHQTRHSGNTTKMVMIDKAAIPAKGTLKFAPGGYHIMLENPKQPIKAGTSIPLTFSFDNGEKVTSQCAIKGASATSATSK